MVNEPVDHREGGDLVAEDLAQAENGLLLVSISEARAQRGETKLNIRFAASGSNGI